MKQKDWLFLERMRTLRESELCRDVAEDVRADILGRSSFATYTAGDLVFRQGDPGDSFYMIHVGIVEIVANTPQGRRVLAYMGPGECFGELSLLIGKSRNAEARVPEHAELIQISKIIFEDLIRNHPSFLRQLCGILAERLDRAAMRAPDPPRPTLLEGQLRYFDLSTMFQALMDSKRTGAMSIEGKCEGKGVQAQLFFDGGDIVWARLGRLLGEEAVYQLFQMRLEGTFQFTGSEGERRPEPNITRSTMSLLLESARLHDELDQFASRIPDRERPLRQLAPALTWTEPEGLKLATELWNGLRRRPLTLGWVLENAPYCQARIYHVVWALMQSGQIE